MSDDSKLILRKARLGRRFRPAARTFGASRLAAMAVSPSTAARVLGELSFSIGGVLGVRARRTDVDRYF